MSDEAAKHPRNFLGYLYITIDRFETFKTSSSLHYRPHRWLETSLQAGLLQDLYQ
jgi:hypothetical protein